MHVSFQRSFTGRAQDSAEGPLGAQDASMLPFFLGPDKILAARPLTISQPGVS